MSQQDNRITMRFEANVTEGGTHKDDILFKNPTNVDKYVEKLENLKLISDPKEGLHVFVIDVTRGDTANKRGAHFKYSKERGWVEILIGTHSHENKDILDAIGDISLEVLPTGTKRLLTIEKEKDENDNEEFKVLWASYPDSLPQIPEALKNSTVYLTTENGEYVWKEQFIPTQTFQYRRVTVTEPSRTILFDNLTFNKMDGDEVLFFDGGVMITDNYTFSDTIIEDVPYAQFTFDTAVFEAGEVITILVIKNGVKGFMDTIANEYLSKKDAIELVSKGSITLKGYATTDALNGKADLVHSHSNYSKVGHRHDDLYANYYHVHSEYISGAQVYATIGDVLSTFLNSDVELTQDDVNGLYLDAINKLKEELEDKIANAIDSSYVDAKIAELKSLLNVDDITINYEMNGEVKELPLSTYLGLLENRIDSVSSDTENVTTTDKLTVNGVDELGGYIEGDVIAPGTPLQNIIHNLITKRIEPTLVRPEADLIINNDEPSYEPGDTITFKLTPIFEQNDGGELENIKLYKTGEDGVVDYDDYDQIYTYDLTQEYNNKTEMNLTLSVEDGDFFIGKLVARYKQGENHADNLGKDDYHIPKGKVEKDIIIKGIRKGFVGKTTGTVRLAQEFEVKNEDFTLRVSELDNRTDVVLAFPKNTVNITSIIYKQQMCEILDMFTRTVELISGSNNYNPVEYDVYRLTLTQVNVQAMDFEIKVGDLDE